MVRLTWRVHEAAHDESTDSTAREMQRRPLFHTSMLDQPPLREEVRRQLHRAPESRPDHRRAHAAIQPPNTLRFEDPRHPIQRIPILVLRTHWQKRGVALQPRLDQEEWRSRRRADDTGCGAAEHVDAEVLRVRVAEEQRREALAHGVVEAETAAVEHDLVNVGAAETAVDAADTLVADYDADAMKGAAVVEGGGAFLLELALQLHTV